MKMFVYAIGLMLAAASPLLAASLPESAKIDEMLASYWAKNSVKPNPPASDAVLVRRLYLDIAGRVPTIEETREFTASTDPQKRVKLIDKLLASDGYTSHMFNYFADLLRLTDNTKGRVTAEAYEEWLKKKLKENTPFDQLVRDLLTTDGGVWDSGAIGFYMRDENKLDHLAYTVQVFLGTQIVCAQCHNHPFDKWTQKEYYHVAGYTYGMDTKGSQTNFLKMETKGKPGGLDREKLKNMSRDERKAYMKKMEAEGNSEAAKASRAEMQEVRRAMQDVVKPLRYTTIQWNEGKSPALPHDYKYDDAKPGDQLPVKTLFGHDAQPANGETRIDAFARWMTSPENPRFTMVIANRMWKKAFGLGLIEPVDEIMDSTVPSIAPLMEHLTQLMAEKKYSIKSFLRVLYNTDAYQRAATTEELMAGSTYHFPGPLLRRMSSEQVWDSMVTMARGNVDDAVDEENTRLHNYLGDLKFFLDTLRDKGAEGLIEVSRQANSQNEANMKKAEELRKEMEALREKGDKEAAQRLARQSQQLRNQKNQDLLVALLGEERARDLRQGYGPKKAAAQINPQDKKALMAKLASLPKEQRKEAMKAMQGAAGGTLATRASEQPSPARPGTFLRTFGQSDREEIDNFNRDASVPQALNLLNGPMLDALTSPVSKLSHQMAEAGSSKAKLDTLYMAFLSRLPDANERKVLDQVIAERGDKAVEDVAQALLTGSQFLFVQ
jgi:hypothetical protein